MEGCARDASSLQVSWLAIQGRAISQLRTGSMFIKPLKITGVKSYQAKLYSINAFANKILSHFLHPIQCCDLVFVIYV